MADAVLLATCVAIYLCLTAACAWAVLTDVHHHEVGIYTAGWVVACVFCLLLGTAHMLVLITLLH